MEYIVTAALVFGAFLVLAFVAWGAATVISRWASKEIIEELEQSPRAVWPQGLREHLERLGIQYIQEGDWRKALPHIRKWVDRNYDVAYSWFRDRIGHTRPDLGSN